MRLNKIIRNGVNMCGNALRRKPLEYHCNANLSSLFLVKYIPTSKWIMKNDNQCKKIYIKQF